MGFVYVKDMTAFVPMDPYEVERFLYGLGLDGPGAKCGIAIVTDYSDYPIDWGTDFRQANRLFQRISDLGDRREDFKVWCNTQERCTVEDALKASCNMWAIDFYPGVNSDELLGQHALDSCFFEEYNNLPDEVYDVLDRAKVGERMREQEGGVFVDGGYLVISEDFAGAEIPAVTPEPLIEVRFRSGEPDTGWLNVPHTPEEEREAAKWLDRESLGGLTMDCRSLIPQFNGIASGSDDLPELRELDKALNHMSAEEILQYKALLEIAKPGNASAALRLAVDMGFYEVDTSFADPVAYGLQHALARHDFDADGRLLDYVDFAAYGAAMLHDEGYESTRYGAVYRNAMAQKFLAGRDTLNSGECYCDCIGKHPTFICWDPDRQKVWLELGAGCDLPIEDLSYYQESCNDWGVRHCATQEAYEQVISELGAQPYDEVMAEDQSQSFGGMGGMA